MTKPSVDWPVFGEPLASVHRMFSDDVTEDLHRLTVRLGFEPVASLVDTWAVVGWVLAQEQAEIKKRGRGRPTLKEKRKPGINYQRYNYLRNRCRELGQELGKDITHEKAVERAINERAPLFSQNGKDLLITSVSRGRGVWEKARRDMVRTWTAIFRAECEKFRARANWLERAQPDLARLEHLAGTAPAAGRGLAEFLFPEGQEIAALRKRLINPYRHFE